MDTPPSILTTHSHPSQTPLPNLRGEDETELSFLISLIETQAWILLPPKHPTCVIGRVPDASDDNPNPSPKYCAALYSMGKGGAKGLDCGPKMGHTRKEALLKLLGHVEMDIGKMMLGDRREKREEGRDMGRDRDREREMGRDRGRNGGARD